MNEIIGRSAEQKELHDIYRSKKAELAVVYGRRRVGKTYLINNYFKNQKCRLFYAIGLRKGSMRTQLERFAQSMSETFFGGIVMQTPKNWNTAFEQLTSVVDKIPSNEKIIIFFDELPWMATNKSMLLQAIDYYWNKYWSNKPNLKIFICGSSASWIIKKIINDRGGLHNRTTRQILLKPFSLNEVKLYLQYIGCNYNNDQLLEIYMAIGGIPFYLSNLKRNLSAAQNINQLCFKETGILFNEFEKLFESLFKNAAAYEEIVRIISTKHYGVYRTEIEMEAKLSTKGGSLSEKLQELEYAGFISSFTPFAHDKRGTLYRVIDEYCLLFINWIEPCKNGLAIKESNHSYWLEQYKTPGWNSWAGYAFESICYKHIGEIRKALNISGNYAAAAWAYRPIKSIEQGVQIDLVIDRRDGAITICEIKYTTGIFELNKSYKDNLLNKVKIFKTVTRTKKQLFLALITTHGIKNNSYSEEYINDVVTLTDLL